MLYGLFYEEVLCNAYSQSSIKDSPVSKSSGPLGLGPFVGLAQISFRGSVSTNFTITFLTTMSNKDCHIVIRKLRELNDQTTSSQEPISQQLSYVD